MPVRSLGLATGLAFVGAVALAACGGKVAVDPGGTTTTTTTIPPTAEKACAAYWDTTCTRAATCDPASTAAFWGDHATCVDGMIPACVSDLEAPGAQTDTAKMLACAQAIASLTCEELVQYLAGEIDVGACSAAPGTLPVGSACGSAGQCASSVCDVPPDEVCGHCTAGELGASCAGLAGCKIGLRCAEGTCVSLGQLGDPCGPSAPCNSAAACVGSKCSPLLPAGAPCDTFALYSPCQVGLLCNPISAVCDTYDAAPLGAPCGFVDGKIHFCAKGSFCQANFPKQDACTPSVAEGDPCEVPPSHDDPCDYPAQCVQGSCRYPDASTCQ